MTRLAKELHGKPLRQELDPAYEELLRRKLRSAAALSVRLLRAMEARFGPEARLAIRDMAMNPAVEPRLEVGEPEADLHLFCERLDRGCVGTHRWTRTVDQPRRIAYRYTRCMWAEIFRELGEPELGAVFCAGDEPAVKAFNPKLAFRRTRVLMHGDDCCDHVFVVSDEDETASAEQSSDPGSSSQ